MPEGYVLDYTGESRQLRVEGSKFLGVFLLAVILIFLVLAAQFNSFRDPFIILLGSVPLAMFRRGYLHVPEDAVRKIFYRQLDDLVQHLLAGRPGHAGRIRFEERHPDCAICQRTATLRAWRKLDAVAQAARTRLRPIMMTSVATVAGHFPLTLVTGAGAAARNSIGLVLVGGMTIGTIFTLFIVPSLYMLIAKEHHESRLSEPERESRLETQDESAFEPEFVNA